MDPEFLAQLYEISEVDHPESIELAKRRLQEAQSRYPQAAQGGMHEASELPEYPVDIWRREGRPKWPHEPEYEHRLLDRQPTHSVPLLERRRGSGGTGLLGNISLEAAGDDFNEMMEEQRKAMKLYKFLERQKHNVMNFLELNKRSPTDPNNEHFDELAVDDEQHSTRRRNTSTARLGDLESSVRVDVEGGAGGGGQQQADQPAAFGEGGARQQQSEREGQEHPQDEAFAKSQMELSAAANMLIQATNAQALFKPLIEALGLHVARIKTTPLMKKFGSCISLSLLLDALSLNIAESEGNPLINPTEYLRPSKRSIDLASRSPSFTCEHFILNLSLREVLTHNPKAKSKQGSSANNDAEPVSDSPPENQPSQDDLEVRRTTTQVSLTITVESIVQHVDMPLIRLVYQIYTIAMNVNNRQQQILSRKHEISSEFRKTHRKQESKSSSASTVTTAASTTSSMMPVRRYESGITSVRSHPRTPAGSGGGVPPPPPLPIVQTLSEVDAPVISEQSLGSPAPAAATVTFQQQPFTAAQIPGIRIDPAPPAASMSSVDALPGVRMRPASRVNRGSNSFRKSFFSKFRLSRKTSTNASPNPESLELAVLVSSAGNIYSSDSQPSASQPQNTPKCWLKMEEAIRIYNFFPELKTVTLQQSQTPTSTDARYASLPPVLTSVPEDDEDRSALLLAPVGIRSSGEQAAAAHTGERRVKITEPTIDQLTHGSALSALIGDRVSVALFSSFNIHRTKVIAKISGLRLEVEFMQIQASATHSRRVHSRLIGESKSLNNSLSAHVGTILTTLSESGSTSQQGVVASINVNTIGAFVAQHERKRATPPGKPARRAATAGVHRRNDSKCSCSLALERITIDIPNQPVALHDMFTRSTKRITNTIQELTRSMYQPVTKSRCVRSHVSLLFLFTFLQSASYLGFIVIEYN